MVSNIPTKENVQLKTSLEMNRDIKNLNEYFLENLNGDIENNISFYSKLFMNELNNFNKLKFNDDKKLKQAFIRITLEKCVNNLYSINQIKNILENINNQKKRGLSLLNVKLKALKNSLKNKEINKVKYLDFFKIHKIEKDIINENYKNKNNDLLKLINFTSLKNLNLFNNIFNVKFNNIFDDTYNSYYSVISNLNLLLKSNELEQSFNNDICENKDFFQNTSKYILFFDGYEFKDFNEIIDLLTNKNTYIENKTNSFIGFFLYYFKSLFLNNKNFEVNYNLNFSSFKEKFVNYYGVDLFEKIGERMNKWTEFLEIYNESLEKVNNQISWGLISFLVKEFIYELNRLIILIFKMEYDPLKLQTI